jgi:hypothetical protein
MTTWFVAGENRIPAWRWHRAELLHATQTTQYSSDDDSWVFAAMRFLRTRDGGKRPADQWTERETAISQALDIYQDKTWRRRGELEARLLTTAPMSGIAERCSLPQRTVESYEALFFDVHSYLTARDWIAIRALRCESSVPSREERLAAVWKSLAYGGGVHVLEVALCVSTNQPLPEWLRNELGPNATLETLQLVLTTKLAIAVALADTPAELAALARIRDRKRRLESLASPERRRDSLLNIMADFHETLTRTNGPARRPARAKRSTAQTPRAYPATT